MTQDRAVLELIRKRCNCGRSKARGLSFCGRCYRLLTKPMQQALYRLSGEDYEKAYERAVEFLDRVTL